MENIKISQFVNDGEKMRDFFDLTKEEFLDSYSYLTEEEYDATAKYVKEHNLVKPLWVCNHCLCAIEAHEGRQMHVNGTSILMTSVNQNVTGAKSLASAPSTKFFKINK